MRDIIVPDVGESVTEVTIANWFKQVGDRVGKDEPLVELETDKAAQELVAPEDGVVQEILVNTGANVAVGTIIARLKAAPDVSASISKTETQAKTERAPSTHTPDNLKKGGVVKPPMPSAQRILSENKLSANAVSGTGKDGRITKADALNASLITHSSRSVETAYEERVPMSRLRQTIARRLKEAQNTAAMLTTYNEVNMSQILDLRQKYKQSFEHKYGVKLGFMGLFVKACVQALKDVPAVNAEIDGTDIIYKNYYNMGIAVGTDKGLVVPVVRHCETLSLAQIECQIAELGTKARAGQLSMDDMRGGTFTISNGGVYGSLLSSPILNPPQSGILGMHKIEKRPIVLDDTIVIRPMMYLALSYDHRIVDGKEAVTFLVRVKECLEDPERLVIGL